MLSRGGVEQCKIYVFYEKDVFMAVATSVAPVISEFSNAEVKVEVVGVGAKRGRLAYVVRPVTYGKRKKPYRGLESKTR
ncbi:hypothetical protein BHM03_00057776 [Ensete ventricosum]|nr:hypothetical protein BHM03_00057776 [Ensete ventricosum]